MVRLAVPRYRDTYGVRPGRVRYVLIRYGWYAAARCQYAVCRHVPCWHTQYAMPPAAGRPRPSGGRACVRPCVHCVHTCVHIGTVRTAIVPTSHVPYRMTVYGTVGAAVVGRGTSQVPGYLNLGTRYLYDRARTSKLPPAYSRVHCALHAAVAAAPG
eukprot:SAG31_NODE_810_length_11919_cov_4.480924_5_plen_157_part_00